MKKRSIERAREQLLARIDKGEPQDCWPWKGALGTYGYGFFTLNGTSMNSSRATYWLLVEPVPKGLVVCHLCDNPACCNPNHLWLGTQGDNVRDCNRKGRGKGKFESATHPRYLAKLTPVEVLIARRLYADGMQQKEIAKLYDVHPSSISRAIRGEKWAHIK